MRTALAHKPEYDDEVSVSSTEVLESNGATMGGELVARMDEQFRELRAEQKEMRAELKTLREDVTVLGSRLNALFWLISAIGAVVLFCVTVGNALGGSR